MVGDSKTLEFIWDRLVNVHGESPDVDYMLAFRKIINEGMEQVIICYDNNDDMWMYNCKFMEFEKYNKGVTKLVDCYFRDYLNYSDIPYDFRVWLGMLMQKQGLNTHSVHLFRRYKDSSIDPMVRW